MQPEEFINEARRVSPELPAPHILQLVIYQAAKVADTDVEDDQNAQFRELVLKELQTGVTLADRPLLRFLLEQEIAYHVDAWGIFESIRLCGSLLSTLAQLEDVPLLWEAKTTSFDTMCGFDIQFLVGAGVAPTLAYLQNIQEKWAQDAREYIEECQQAGDFR